MPELPEVETIGRQLQRLVVGKTISSIEILNPGSFRADAESLIGKTITKVGRKGKVLIITGDLAGIAAPACRRGRSSRRHVGTPRNDGYDTDSTILFVHLKMSGQLEFFNQNISNPSKKARPFSKRPGLSRSKHLRVAIGFTNGSHLLFHDQRKFGWITDDPAALPPGTDALDPQLTPKKLAEILASSSRPVKTILLDQSKIAGIGNIYASEILWQAGISPLAKFKEEGKRKKEEGDGNKLVKFACPAGRRAKLHAAIREVLTDAIDSGGSTMNDKLYRHVSGNTGNYWPRRRVYDREGKPCLRCKIPIKKGIIGQRSTYWCTSCQSN